MSEWNHYFKNIFEWCQQNGRKSSSGPSFLNANIDLTTTYRKQCLCESSRNQLRLSTDFSVEILQAKGSEIIYSKYWKENCQPIILYLAKQSFKIEGKIKTFPENGSWESSTPNLPYTECWRDFFEWKWRDNSQ